MSRFAVNRAVARTWLARVIDDNERARTHEDLRALSHEWAPAKMSERFTVAALILGAQTEVAALATGDATTASLSIVEVESEGDLRYAFRVDVPLGPDSRPIRLTSKPKPFYQLGNLNETGVDAGLSVLTEAALICNRLLADLDSLAMPLINPSEWTTS